MASVVYNKGMYEIISGGTSWTTSNLDVLLVDDAYVFNPDENFVADLPPGQEIATTNYVRKDLPAPTVTENDAGNSVDLDADPITWIALGPPTGGPVIGGAIVFRNTGADATSPLIAFMDVADIQVNGGDLTVNWNALGMIVSTSP